MSQRRRRRRTPTVMDRVPEPQASVSETPLETATDEASAQACDSGDDQPADLAPPPSRSTDRLPTTDWLDGEPLTTAMITRYFKLTAVMLGLNVVLASVSVVALFRPPSEPRTIVVAAPTPAPAQPAVLPSPPLPSTQAPSPPATNPEPPVPPAPRAFPATPAPTVEKTPLLGAPPSKRSVLASAATPKRPPVATVKISPPAPAASEDEAPGVHLAERW
jgi:hypothetical protein